MTTCIVGITIEGNKISITNTPKTGFIICKKTSPNTYIGTFIWNGKVQRMISRHKTYTPLITIEDRYDDIRLISRAKIFKSFNGVVKEISNRIEERKRGINPPLIAFGELLNTQRNINNISVLSADIIHTLIYLRG